MPRLTLEDAAREIAKLLVPLLIAYRDVSDETMRGYLKEIIQFMCRRMEEFVTPKVSQKAKMTAFKLGIDLGTLHWKHQSKCDPGRKTFHLDHCLDVRTMREQLMSLPNPTAEAVETILAATQVAWILKEEDAVLNKRGYKHSRKDWRKCYQDAGIELS